MSLTAIILIAVYISEKQNTNEQCTFILHKNERIIIKNYQVFMEIKSVSYR